MNLDFQLIFRKPQQLKLMDSDGARFALHLYPLAGQFVERLPLVLESGVHRRDLLNFSGKPLQHLADLLLVQFRNGAALDYLTLGIGAAGTYTNLDGAAVTLVCIQQKGGHLGRLTQTDGQHTAGHGIEVAGMSGLARPEQLFDRLQRPV